MPPRCTVYYVRYKMKVPSTRSWNFSTSAASTRSPQVRLTSTGNNSVLLRPLHQSRQAPHPGGAYLGVDRRTRGLGQPIENTPLLYAQHSSSKCGDKLQVAAFRHVLN